MKNVVVTIKGKSFTEGKDVDVTEVCAIGSLKSATDGVSVTYDDSMSVGVNGVTATLKAFYNGLVTIERKGILEHKLMVEKDKRHLCIYTTPYGNMTVGVFGVELDNRLTPDGGDIFMKYTLDINSGLISENEIEINIKAVN